MKWTVTKQRPMSRPGPGNTVTDGYLVTVTTDTGHDDQVFVPLAQHNPEGVAALVNAQLSKVAAVDGLQGET